MDLNFGMFKPTGIIKEANTPDRSGLIGPSFTWNAAYYLSRHFGANLTLCGSAYDSEKAENRYLSFAHFMAGGGFAAMARPRERLGIFAGLGAAVVSSSYTEGSPADNDYKKSGFTLGGYGDAGLRLILNESVYVGCMARYLITAPKEISINGSYTNLHMNGFYLNLGVGFIF